MTHKPATSLALCAAQPLPEGDAPEWVHLLPSAGGTIGTHDGRGPYRVTDPAAIITASLAETATLEEIIAAVEAMTGAKGKAEEDVALQSELGTILGVDGNRDALIAAARLAVSGKDALVALQSQVTAQAAELKGIRDAATRATAEAFVDGEIARKRVGLNAANRADFVTLHMSQPETARKLIEGMPVAGETHTAQLPSAIKGGAEFLSLNAEQQGRVLHDKAKAFQTEQAGKGLTVTLIDAIQHVKKEMRL